uniref:HERV-H LTR-associating 2a, tandem duplicate 1 n=1 Tax=Paramormyrops kingsleyae TaxID=1676925 RepID=A0A3B3Q501_9TELE|nr:CD276 antigen homolog [Paramormyrops kingsleyae]
MPRVSPMAAAWLRLCALLWTFTLPSTHARTPEINTTITCLLSTDCILPCRFRPAGEPLITWYKQGVTIYNSTGSSNRTSLFKEQLATGNASLLLRSCTLRDRGRYTCRINNTLGEQQSTVILRVEAPVRFVTVEMAPSPVRQLKCTSRDIYPAPRLQWSMEPALPLQALRPSTRMVAERSGLYSVQSTLGILENLSGRTYICTVIGSYGTQISRASLSERDVTGIEGQALSIPCLAPMDLQNFTLSWAFMMSGQPTVFLNFSSRTGEVANNWADRVRLDPAQAQSGDGSLKLQNSQEMKGTYTCIFSTDHSKHQVYIHLRTSGAEAGQSHARLWIIVVVVIALLLLGAMILLYTKKKGVFHSWSRMSDLAEARMEMNTVETDANS